MKNSQPTNHNFEAIAWGAFFIWWGITNLFQFLPDGTGAIGIGLILVGLNAARALNRIPTSSFTTTLGIIAIILGGVELVRPILHLPFELPIFAIILIVLGGSCLVREIARTKTE